MQPCWEETAKTAAFRQLKFSVHKADSADVDERRLQLLGSIQRQPGNAVFKGLDQVGHLVLQRMVLLAGTFSHFLFYRHVVGRNASQTPQTAMSRPGL
jgi:hypothetical protein